MDDRPALHRSPRAALARLALAAALVVAAPSGLADTAPTDALPADATRLKLDFVPPEHAYAISSSWRRHHLVGAGSAHAMDGDIVTKDVLRMLIGKHPLPIAAAGATEISLDYDDDSDFGLKFERRVQR